MPLEVVLPYPVALTAAAVSIYFSFRLYKQYRLRYLLVHLNYQIFTYFSHFINSIGLTMAVSILTTVDSQGGKPLASFIFNPLITPVVAVSLYLFLRFAAAWLDVTIPRWILRVYLTVWILLLLFNTITVIWSWQGGDSSSLTFSVWLIDTSGIVTGYAIILFLMWRGHHIKDRLKKRAVRTYAATYFVGFLVLDLITSKILAAWLGFPRGPMICTLVFLVHLPPLFQLYRFVNTYYRKTAVQSLDSPDMQAFLIEHNISKREREIIDLLLAGKSNQQMEDELYISIGTVKNHLYNIYQKLQVKNRLQLVSLLTKLDSRPPESNSGNT